MMSRSDFEVLPLTPARWQDLEVLFGERGACGGCWCMWWRLSRSQFAKQKGAGNKRAFKKIVDSGEVPGLLAYRKGQPIGWCAIAPRDRLPALERSRILKRVDDQPVWSVGCFFVAQPYRHKGVTKKLLLGAKQYARKQGATVLEGYPVDPGKNATPDVFAWTGIASAFRGAGFKEVIRRSKKRPIVRCFLDRMPRNPEGRGSCTSIRIEPSDD